MKNAELIRDQSTSLGEADHMFYTPRVLTQEDVEYLFANSTVILLMPDSDNYAMQRVSAHNWYFGAHPVGAPSGAMTVVLTLDISGGRKMEFSFDSLVGVLYDPKGMPIQHFKQPRNNVYGKGCEWRICWRTEVPTQLPPRQ